MAETQGNTRTLDESSDSESEASLGSCPTFGGLFFCASWPWDHLGAVLTALGSLLYPFLVSPQSSISSLILSALGGLSRLCERPSGFGTMAIEAVGKNLDEGIGSDHHRGVGLGKAGIMGNTSDPVAPFLFHANLPNFHFLFDIIDGFRFY